MSRVGRSPPRLAERLIQRALRTAAAQHGVIGDLREEYRDRLRRSSGIACDLWFWRQAAMVFWRFRREANRTGGTRPHHHRGEIASTVLQDVRYAVRGFRRNPGFTLVIVLTISLGIGATSTIFSLVNSILLRPLSYHEPDRIVAVWPERWFSKALFDLIEEQTTSYEALAAWSPRSHVVIDNNGATRHWGPRVTAQFFDVLEPAVAIGRTFAEGEDEPGSDDVLVISYGFWQRYFGGDPDVLGRRMRVRDIDRTIIGVMREGFDFLMPDAEMAVPQDMDRSAPGYGSSEMKAIGRLRPGVSIEQAQADLDAFVTSVKERSNTPDDWGHDARVVSFHEYMVREFRPTLLLLFGAVGLLLLIATANVANLFLTRSLSRRREVSVRLALGASPRRLLRQLGTESVLLGVLGAVPGVVLAVVGLRAVIAILPADNVLVTDLPRIGEVRVDAVVLMFCIALGILAGWIAGLAPALRAGNTDLRESLGGGGRGGTETRSGRRLRTGVVVVEVALAVLLLSGSGLLMKSFWRLTRVDPGFQPEGLLGFTVVPDGRFESAADFASYYRLLHERMEAIPGVVSMAAAWALPLAPDGGISRLYAAENPPPQGTPAPQSRWRPVTPRYFRTAGIPLLQGRLLADTDGESGEPVAVLTQTAATRLFPDGNAIGRQVVSGMEGSDHLITVVGIVGDVKTLGLDQGGPLIIYRPYSQVGAAIERFGFRTQSILLRTTGDPYAVGPQVREGVRTVDQNALVVDMQSLSDAISGSLANPRMILLLIVSFTTAAVTLGAIGVYGIMGHTVKERGKEIGIRVALGATQATVLREVLVDGLKIAGAGSAVGIGLSLLFARLLESFVFEVGTADPFVFSAAVVVSLSVALVAVVVPARRAGAVDPTVTLRAE